MKKDRIIGVGELSRAIKSSLESSFGSVTVQGEISNYKGHSSGHRYFTLKDENAQISCVMWRSRVLAFEPDDGMKVVVRGRLTVYPPRGNYQIDCTSMTPLGQGDLFLAFEALKKKLGGLGYFDPENKKELPALPMNIGVATSPTGAAVRDIFSVLERRAPAATVYFRPTTVQGDGAAEDIAQAIEDLNNTPSELIIIGRGGGSLEDLWAFNTEITAAAVYNSTTPVISAVGHETDFTIADFTADVRAATPTAAAEIATPRTHEELLRGVSSRRDAMIRTVEMKVDAMRDALGAATRVKTADRLIDKIRLYSQQIDELEIRAGNGFNRKKQFLMQKIAALESHCRSLAPLAPLGRGFALLKAEGKILSNDMSLAKYRKIEIVRENETAEAKINKILPKPLF